MHSSMLHLFHPTIVCTPFFYPCLHLLFTLVHTSLYSCSHLLLLLFTPLFTLVQALFTLVKNKIITPVLFLILLKLNIIYIYIYIYMKLNMYEVYIFMQQVKTIVFQFLSLPFCSLNTIS